MKGLIKTFRAIVNCRQLSRVIGLGSLIGLLVLRATSLNCVHMCVCSSLCASRDLSGLPRLGNRQAMNDAGYI